MKGDEDYSSLVKDVIYLHENPDFQKLSTLVSRSVIEDKESWFGEEKYEEVCNAIERELGANLSVDHIIDSRKSSVYSLWKARYSKCDYEVLWHIYVDNDGKICAMAVDWGQI